MREFVSVHTGQCGVQQAQKVWNQVLKNREVKMKADEDKLNHDSYIFLDLNSKDQVRPRALVVDSEPTVIDSLLEGNLKNMFKCNHVKGQQDASSNFARGYNYCQKYLHERVKNKLRQEAERCEQMTAFFDYRAIGGGTGSGYSVLLWQWVADSFKKASVISFVNQPSASFSATVEPYNACLSISSTSSLLDVQFNADNATLYNLLSNYVKPAGMKDFNPTYSHMNELTAMLFSHIAKAIDGGTSIGSMQQNLVPFPGINFLTTALLPLMGKGQTRAPQDVWNLNFDVFSVNSEFQDIKLDCGKYIAVSCIYCGDVDEKKLNASLQELRTRSAFVSWMPTGFKIMKCRDSPFRSLDKGVLSDLNKSLLRISNHTAMGQTVEHLQKKFNTLLSKRSFSHWFLDEAMLPEHFVNANNALFNIAECYDDCFTQE